MSIVRINKNIIPGDINIDDISDYVESRLNKHYCFEDIIRFDEMDADCDDLEFTWYIDMKTSLVSSYIHYSSKDYLSGVILKCNCLDDDDDDCNCTYDNKKINSYIFSCLCKFFDISDLTEMENGLRRYLSLNKCSICLFDAELDINDSFKNYLSIKQKLVDKFLGIEGDKDER